MNKIYQTIWNSALGSWVAVAEMSKSKRKRNKKQSLSKTVAPLILVGALSYAGLSYGICVDEASLSWTQDSTGCPAINITSPKLLTDLSATGGGVVLTINGNGNLLSISGNSAGLILQSASNASIVINGSLDASGSGVGVDATGGASVYIKGDYSADVNDYGISANSSQSLVEIDSIGVVKSVSQKAIKAINHASIFIKSSSRENSAIISDNSSALYAQFSGKITVAGDVKISAKKQNIVQAYSNSEIYLENPYIDGADLESSKRGVQASGNNALVSISGKSDIVIGGTNIGANDVVGIEAFKGGTIQLGTQTNISLAVSDGSSGGMSAHSGSTINSSGSVYIVNKNAKGVSAYGGTIRLNYLSSIIGAGSDTTAYAARAINSGNLSFNDAYLVSEANGAHALFSEGTNLPQATSITANGFVQAISKGDNAGAIVTSGNSAIITLNGGLDATTSGQNADGISVRSGSITAKGALSVNVTGSSSARTNAVNCGLGAAICVAGDNAFFDASKSTGGTIKSTGYALQLENGNKTSSKINGSNISTSGTLSLIEVNAQNGTAAADVAVIDLTNSRATASNSGTGILLNVGSSSNLKFTASGSTLYGGIKSSADSTVNMELKKGSSLIGYIDPINLDIDGTSQWSVTESSTLENLTNAGTVSFTHVNAFKTVTVDSYVGVPGSKLGINTYLDNDASASDKLVISALKAGVPVGTTTVGGPTTGGTATGSTSIYVTNRGGLGAQTVDKGILVVKAESGATTTVNAFSLGQTVSAGAYEYSLYRNDDESWYLFSSKNQVVPDYSDEASATPVLGPLAQLYNSAILGSWRERMGGMAYANPQQLNMQRDAVAPLWVRVGGGRGRHTGGQASWATSSSLTYSPDYRYNFNFLQMGGDIYQRHTEQGSRQVGGVYFTTGTIYGDVFSYEELTAARSNTAALAKVDNIALGAYWTHVGANGSYVDIVGQYTDHDLTVRQADNVTGSGRTWTASIEAGKAMALNASWTLVPQVQLRWQNIQFKDMTAIASQQKVGTYHFANNNSTEARLGLEARYRTGPRDVAWLRLDMLHEFNGLYTSQYTPVQTGQAQPQFVSSRKGSAVELLEGMELEVAPHVAVYGATGYRKSLSHHSEHAWNAQLGVRWWF